MLDRTPQFRLYGTHRLKLFYYSSQYFGIFPQVSCPEFVTKLCFQSSQQRVGRASICFHRTQEYCLHRARTQTSIAAKQVSESFKHRACNKTVSPQQSETPCRSCVNMFLSHTAVLSPRRTDSNIYYYYSGQYLACFRRSLAKNLQPDCVSTAIGNTVSVVRQHVQYCLHRAPAQIMFLGVNTSAYFHKYHAQSL